MAITLLKGFTVAITLLAIILLKGFTRVKCVFYETYFWVPEACISRHYTYFAIIPILLCKIIVGCNYLTHTFEME